MSDAEPSIPDNNRCVMELYGLFFRLKSRKKTGICTIENCSSRLHDKIVMEENWICNNIFYYLKCLLQLHNVDITNGVLVFLNNHMQVVQNMQIQMLEKLFPFVTVVPCWKQFIFSIKPNSFLACSNWFLKSWIHLCCSFRQMIWDIKKKILNVVECIALYFVVIEQFDRKLTMYKPFCDKIESGVIYGFVPREVRRLNDSYLLGLYHSIIFIFLLIRSDK